MEVIILANIKLQFSVVCEWSDGKNIGNIYNGFTPGVVENFYIVNKWIWLEKERGILNEADAAKCFYQETKIIEQDQKKNILSLSKSNNFQVKNSHTHNNRYSKIEFKENKDYRVEVSLFSSEGNLINSASIKYPIFVKRS